MGKMFTVTTYSTGFWDALLAQHQWSPPKSKHTQDGCILRTSSFPSLQCILNISVSNPFPMLTWRQCRPICCWLSRVNRKAGWNGTAKRSADLLIHFNTGRLLPKGRLCTASYGCSPCRATSWELLENQAAHATSWHFTGVVACAIKQHWTCKNTRQKNHKTRMLVTFSNTRLKVAFASL